jgi:FtsZ-binding cell division protein ZapB
MGGAAEELKQRLSQQIDAAKRKLELLKQDIAELHDEDMAGLSDRQAELRGRLEQQRSRAEQLQSRIASWKHEKRTRAVDAITSWEQRREIEKLQAHAQRAEDIAVDMVTVATHDFEEAEQAVLEALAARMEADQALAPA